MADLHPKPHHDADLGPSTPPDITLGPAFVRGWRSLPDELKVEILSYNFIFEERVSPFFNKERLSSHDTAFSLVKERSEISEIAKEIFFGKNIFALDLVFGSLSIRTVRPDFTHLIRTLEVSICVKACDWKYLHKISKGKFGFENLQTVKIIIDGRGFVGMAGTYKGIRERAFRKAMQASPIIFNIKRLEVDFMYSDEPSWISLPPTAMVRTYVEPWLSQCLTARFGGNQNEMKETLTETTTSIFGTVKHLIRVFQH